MIILRKSCAAISTGIALCMIGDSLAQAPAETSGERKSAWIDDEIEMDAAAGGLRLIKLHLKFTGSEAYTGPSTLPLENHVFLLVKDEPNEKASKVIWSYRLRHRDDMAPEHIWKAGLLVDASRKTTFVTIGEVWPGTLNTLIFQVDREREIGRYPYSFDPKDSKAWPEKSEPSLKFGEGAASSTIYSLRMLADSEGLLVAYELDYRMTRTQRYYRVNPTTWKWREVSIEKKVEKLPPAVPGSVRWNEEAVTAILKQISAVEKECPFKYAVFASGYWVADVFGIYGIGNPNDPYALISKEIARADRFPLPAETKRGTGFDPLYPDPPPSTPISFNGYLFESLVNDETGNPYQDDPKRNTHHNKSRFGFRAIPAEYGKTGTRTFQVNEKGVVYAKDLGSGAEKNPPRGNWEGGAEPEKAGWTVVD